MDEVVVIIGVRGFGLPTAKRLGKGRHLLLGDVNPEILETSAQILVRDGYKVTARHIDVTDPASVQAFADLVPELGWLRTLVITAGLSARMASPDRLFEVNLTGTITVLETFEALIRKGTVGVVLASNAAYYAPIPSDVEDLMATGDPAEIVERAKTLKGADTGLGAYWLAKRCNQLRVQAVAPAWGRRGGRIVSVSPGIISTEMIHFERDIGSPVDSAIAGQPIDRIGLPDEIAAAIEWLSGPDAGYITGTDLLIDGGYVAGLRWANMQSEDPQDASRQAKAENAL